MRFNVQFIKFYWLHFMSIKWSVVWHERGVRERPTLFECNKFYIKITFYCVNAHINLIWIDVNETEREKERERKRKKKKQYYSINYWLKVSSNMFNPIQLNKLTWTNNKTKIGGKKLWKPSNTHFLVEILIAFRFSELTFSKISKTFFKQ